MFGKKDIESVFLALMTNRICLSFANVATDSFSTRIALKLYMPLEKAISILSGKNGASHAKSRRSNAFGVVKRFRFSKYENSKIKNGICKSTFAKAALRN